MRIIMYDIRALLRNKLNDYLTVGGHVPREVEREATALASFPIIFKIKISLILL